MLESTSKNRWSRVAFGDVVQLSRERSTDPEEDGLERYVGLEHIEPGDLKIRRWGEIAEGTTFTNVFRAGQVLFGKRRAYQRKVAVADFDGVCSGDIYVLEPMNEYLLPELLPFICQTDGFFEHAVGTSAGSLSPRTNWDSLASYEFALPPLEEQRRIATIFSACETLRAKLRDALDVGRRQAASLYWAFVTGQAFRGRTRDLAGWTHGRLPGIDQMPERWALVRLTDVAKLQSGHTPSKRKPEYWDGGIPWISLHDTAALDRPLISKTAQSITKLGLANSSARLLPRGTVVLSRTASVGLSSVMSRDMATSQDFANFICDEDRLLSVYLYYVFQAMKPYFRHVASGSTHKTVYLPFFEEMQILLPPMNQQAEIVSRLADVDASLNALTKRSDDCQSLTRCLLARLLSGGIS